MATYSFDIVSQYEVSEITNALNQTQREISQRYDLKGTEAKIDFTDKNKTSAIIYGDAEHQLHMVLDIFRKRIAARGIDQKVLDISAKPESGNPWRWTIAFRNGIPSEQAKIITKKIRDSFPKIKTQIQGDTVRVTGSSKDDLQAVMQLARQLELDQPLQFTNYR